jgi:glutathione S-transferase
MQGYTKVNAYVQMLMKDFSFWTSTYSFKKEKKPLLGYWNIRGLSAALRYQLIYQGVDFEQKRFTGGKNPEWKNEKWILGMDFPNLPYFIDGDFKMSETNAIHEYIAAKWMPKVMGSNPSERGQVAMLGNIVHEMIMGVAMPCYSGEKEKSLTAIQDKLPALITFLGSKKFLIGDQPCWPDFKLYESIQLMKFLKEDLFVEYPALE